MVRAWTWICCVMMAVCCAGRAEETAVSFQKQLVPILVEKCVGCHNAEKSEGDYSMETFEALMKGGARGTAIEPGKPAESYFSRMLHGTEEPSMPFEEDKLDDATIALVDQWIAAGAKFDGPNVAVPLNELMPAESKRVIDRNSKIPVPISALAFRPDGEVLAASGYHEITFWKPTSGELVARWPIDAERVLDLEYSGDGAHLLQAGGTPGSFGEVVVWSTASGQPIRRLFESKDLVFASTFRPGAAEVAAGGTDRIFRVWNWETGEQLHAIENHADWILGLSYTPDGKRLLTASRDRSAKVWDQTSGEPILTFAQHTDGVYDVGSNPDGTVACSVGADKTLRLWKIDGNGEQTVNVAGHSDVASRLVFAKSGKFIITVGNDKRVVAWNPADGKIIREFPGHEDFVYSVALSPDESKLATGSWDGEIRVWNTETGELIKQFIAVPALATAQAP